MMNQFGAFSLLSLHLFAIAKCHASKNCDNKFENINKDYSFLHNNYQDQVVTFVRKKIDVDRTHFWKRLHEQPPIYHIISKRDGFFFNITSKKKDKQTQKICKDFIFFLLVGKRPYWCKESLWSFK